MYFSEATWSLQLFLIHNYSQLPRHVSNFYLTDMSWVANANMGEEPPRGPTADEIEGEKVSIFAVVQNALTCVYSIF